MRPLLDDGVDKRHGGYGAVMADAGEEEALIEREEIETSAGKEMRLLVKVSFLYLLLCE